MANTAKKDTGVVSIHGKEYYTVAHRIKQFRDEYSGFTISTEVVSANDEMVVMKASILNDDGRLISTGYAEEKRNSTMINKTSALENAESSAVGRALAFFGLAGTEIASADEVANAIAQQARKNGDTAVMTKQQERQFVDGIINHLFRLANNNDVEGFHQVTGELENKKLDFLNGKTERQTVWLYLPDAVKDFAKNNVIED